MSKNKKNVVYMLGSAVRRHGLHVVGTVEGWMNMIETVRGNSNVALALGTFFAAPLLCLANEPGGGFHLFGPNTIGKSLASALGQSIYGWPHEMADDAFGVSWDGTEAGSAASCRARRGLGVPLDE